MSNEEIETVTYKELKIQYRYYFPRYARMSSIVHVGIIHNKR